MKVLFVHNNFPAQFRNIVEALQEMGHFELAAIGADSAQAIDGVAIHRYSVQSVDVSTTHPFARRFDAECRRAEACTPCGQRARVFRIRPRLHPRPLRLGRNAPTPGGIPEGEADRLRRVLLSRRRPGRSLRS